MTTTKRKPKIPPLRVASDTCLVTVGQTVAEGKVTHPGTAYAVHLGEWVEVQPAMTVREVAAWDEVQRIGASLNMGEGNAEAAFLALCRQLAKRIVGWTWTDMDGEPLPNPHDQPDILMSLTNDELTWLARAVSGQEAPEERKNGSGPSPSTS